MEGSAARASVVFTEMFEGRAAAHEVMAVQQELTLARNGTALENRAVFEGYKAFLRSQMEKPHIVDHELQEIVKVIYRPNARVGSGSTAAAIRYERMTKSPVGGKFHFQKGREQIKCLEKWLEQYPNASHGDRAAVENIIKDLQNALME